MFRKFLTLFFILCTVVVGYSQQTISVRKNPSENNLKIKPLKDTVFYVGVNNPFKIIPHLKDCSKIKVTTDNGVIELADTCTYQFTPAALKPTHIFITKGDKTTTIDATVKLTPDPTWNMLDTTNTVSIKKLQDTKGLIFVLENFKYGCSFKVMWYTILIERNGAAIADKQVKGPQFPSNFFSAVMPADRLTFYAIGIEGPDGFRQLPDIHVTLK
ncbi:MAG: hypothetical protein V4608_04005 [Bacteroidota bacterium]